MEHFLGIDLGTSYFKFGIYDDRAKLKGLSRIEVGKETGDGVCELPIERFVDHLHEGISRACEQADIRAEKIASTGFSSQANSFVLLDSDFRALTPLILWPDSRYPEVHKDLEKLWSRPDFLQKTGLGIAAGVNFCVNKLAWIRQKEPNLWSRAVKVMTISDYLTFLFTGRMAGDVGTASLLGLCDCENAQWWHEAFELLELKESMFCDRLGAASRIESCDGSIARQIGLDRKAVFYIGSLDHHMAAVGAGVSDSSDMSISIGTVLACVNFTQSYQPREGVCISPWNEGRYCQLIFDGNGAVSLEWYHRNFATDISFEELIASAGQVDSSDGLAAGPMAFQCRRREEAFTGIGQRHSHGHFVRAIMESCARTLDELIITISPDKKPERIFATGGGAKSRLWLEIISEITGCEIISARQNEPATFGAVKVQGSFV